MLLRTSIYCPRVFDHPMREAKAKEYGASQGEEVSGGGQVYVMKVRQSDSSDHTWGHTDMLDGFMAALIMQIKNTQLCS